MSAFLPEYRFIIPLAAGLSSALLLLQPAAWYLDILLLFLFIGIVVITRTWPDRGFYQVCSSVPLIAVSGIMNLWAGMFTVWMVAGTTCTSLGLLASREDQKHFLLFCGSVSLITLLIGASNHVLLPLLVLTTTVAVVLAVQSVRTYQFRKRYTGAGQ
jgi:hypothetical protein